MANQMCMVCANATRDQTWKSLVQVRNKADHQRSLLYVEQMVLRNNAHAYAVGAEPVPGGLDFYFGSRTRALHFVDFIKSIVPATYATALLSSPSLLLLPLLLLPCHLSLTWLGHAIRTSEAKQLVSQDVHAGTHHLRYTFSVLLLPVSRDDLCILPPKQRAQLGGIGPAVICARLTALLHFVDPCTGAAAELSVDKFQR